LLDHLVARSPKANTIQPISAKALEVWSKAQPAAVQNWIKAAGFKAKPGSFLLLPDAVSFLAGVEEGIDRWSLANLPASLPAGTYQLIEDDLSPAQLSAHAFAWAMGCYRFARYRSDAKTFASLVWPQGADRAAVERSVRAIGLGRDLINTPAEHMGPADLAKAVEKIGRAHV
jgi:leucyl aminopeptidase